MLAAQVPASVIDVLAAHPEVEEINLVEKQSAQLATSVPSLGAPMFWNAGYTGAGESVAVMDTGVRTSHPAFSGLNLVHKVFLVLCLTNNLTMRRSARILDVPCGAWPSPWR
jgi:hypothetical protein